MRVILASPSGSLSHCRPGGNSLLGSWMPGVCRGGAGDHSRWVLEGPVQLQIWHFPVNLLKHSPIPVSGAVDARSGGDGHAALIHRPDPLVLDPALVTMPAVLGPCGCPVLDMLGGGGLWAHRGPAPRAWPGLVPCRVWMSGSISCGGVAIAHSPGRRVMKLEIKGVGATILDHRHPCPPGG